MKRNDNSYILDCSVLDVYEARGRIVLWLFKVVDVIIVIVVEGKVIQFAGGVRRQRVRVSKKRK